jgi:hypothetical protein
MILSIIVVMPMIGVQSAYAQVIHYDHPEADFKSGYDHGIADASDPCKVPRISCLGYVRSRLTALSIKLVTSSTDMSPDSVKLSE